MPLSCQQIAMQAHPQSRCAIALSPGIRAIRYIERFVDVDAVLSPQQAANFNGEVVSVLVWGRKANSVAARAFAQQNELPVWFLEDGWIRTSASHAHSRTCYSLLVDHQGVYYDASSPSEFESQLNLSDTEFYNNHALSDIEYAARCRQVLVSNNITKYNYCKQTHQRRADRALVLVVDQTRDDASVLHGGMDATRFIQMLDAAIDENPHAEIVVRTHPDVVNGLRQGYLSNAARVRGIAVVAGLDNPVAAIKQADRIYVGTSQLGYEALLCQRSVSVFGQPFYSGWGLTDDRQPVSRRTQVRSVDEMFHVSHVVQARYRNPITGAQWQLHDCLEHVRLQQRMFASNAQHFLCSGITAWKRGYIRQYLRSPDGKVEFSRSCSQSVDTKFSHVTWGYRQFDGEPKPFPVHRVEDGFLRSSGLGSDFNAPASLVIDSSGMYFDPSGPSDLETLLNQQDCTPANIARAVRLKRFILSAGLSKYNVGVTGNVLPTPADKRIVLVVGQVEDDQSIRRGCDQIATNAGLLQAVRAARPDAWIRYKPHPDVVSGNRRGHVETAILSRSANVVDDQSSIIDCIENCDELHTMTSLSGFEALLRGKQVVTYGAPFYAGWGLTHDQQPITRRTRRRTLDELVYLALIVYPRYVDMQTGEFMTPEDLVSLLKNQRAMNNKNKPLGWSGRQFHKAINIVRGLRYAS